MGVEGSVSGARVGRQGDNIVSWRDVPFHCK